MKLRLSFSMWPWNSEHHQETDEAGKLVEVQVSRDGMWVR